MSNQYMNSDVNTWPYTQVSDYKYERKISYTPNYSTQYQSPSYNGFGEVESLICYIVIAICLVCFLYAIYCFSCKKKDKSGVRRSSIYPHNLVPVTKSFIMPKSSSPPPPYEECHNLSFMV